MTTFLCDCVTLETNIKSLPSSVRQLLISRCTASSSRNSRNAYPADQEGGREGERERGREGGREGEREVGGVEIALSSCISDTLVKQDVCCRHVLYTWWYTTAIQKHNYTDISGLPFQVAKFSMTRLYKPIVLHMHTSSLLCTQSHCRYKHTVVSHTKHDITRKAGTGSSLGNSIQTPWPTQGLKEEHCQHPGNTTLSYKTHQSTERFCNRLLLVIYLLEENMPLTGLCVASRQSGVQIEQNAPWFHLHGKETCVKPVNETLPRFPC